MPLKPEDFLAALEMDGMTFEKPEEFVAEFRQRFKPADAAVSDDDVKRITGLSFRKAGVDLKRRVKAFTENPELALDDKKPFEELLADGFTAIEEHYKNKLEELKSLGTDDKKVEHLTAEIEKYKSKWNEEKTAKSLLVEDYDKFRLESEGRLKSEKKNFLITDYKSKNVKFAQGVSDITKIGFDKLLDDKYNWELNEEENGLVITDKKGAQIPNPRKAGSFLSPAEVLEMEGVKEKVWQENSHAQNNRNNVQQPNHMVTPPADGGEGRQVAPRVAPARTM